MWFPRNQTQVLVSVASLLYLLSSLPIPLLNSLSGRTVQYLNKVVVKSAVLRKEIKKGWWRRMDTEVVQGERGTQNEERYRVGFSPLSLDASTRHLE